MRRCKYCQDQLLIETLGSPYSMWKCVACDRYISMRIDDRGSPICQL